MTLQTNLPSAAAEAPIRALYTALLDAWNQRQAAEYSLLFSVEGSLVGFDGSTVGTRASIQSHLSQIFNDHQTGRYVGIVREVRFLSPQVALLQAVADLIPHGQADLNPSLNAVQSMLAVQDQDGRWRVAHYQNTPAQFHGRPDLAEQLTSELRGRI
jgi:uncharacterized protein (TIGR02246 family)